MHSNSDWCLAVGNYFAFSISYIRSTKLAFWGACVSDFTAPCVPDQSSSWIHSSPKSMQIKHGGCCLSECRRLCALINLYNFNRHKWGCYHFCVRNTGLLVMVELFMWTTGLLLGYVVHVNDCLGADRAECWGWCNDGRVKMIHALSANFSSSAEMLDLFLTSTMELGHDPGLLPPSPTHIAQ